MIYLETTLHSFYEVFCELKTPDELTSEFSEVFVERLLMKKSINLLEVHIVDNRKISGSAFYHVNGKSN